MSTPSCRYGTYLDTHCSLPEGHDGLHDDGLQRYASLHGIREDWRQPWPEAPAGTEGHCWALFPERLDTGGGLRTVRCDLPYGHDGDHEEHQGADVGEVLVWPATTIMDTARRLVAFHRRSGVDRRQDTNAARIVHAQGVAERRGVGNGRREVES